MATSFTIAENSPESPDTSSFSGSTTRSLSSNVTWTLASNLVSAACQWGIVVAIAKIGNASMVGQYALALAVVAPIILFSNLQLRAIQATDTDGQFEFGDYLAVRITATALAACAILLLLKGVNYGTPTALAILGLTFSKAMEGLSDVFYGFLQKQERMDRIAQSTIIRMPLSLAALIAIVYWTHAVFLGILGLAIVQIVVVLSYDIPVSVRVAREMQSNTAVSFWPKWRPSIMKQIAWVAAPLGAAMLLISLQTNIPRYFLERYLGEREVGIFAGLAYFLAAGNIVTEAIGQSVIPRLARMFQRQNRKALQKLLLILVAIGSVGGGLALLAGWLAGRQLLTLFYRPEYARHIDVFIVLLSSAAPTYIASFLGYAMTAARLLWLQVPLSLLSTGTVTLFCMWLVPKQGLLGAAYAVLALSLVRLVVTCIVMQRAIRPAKPI